MLTHDPTGVQRDVRFLLKESASTQLVKGDFGHILPPMVSISLALTALCHRPQGFQRDAESWMARKRAPYTDFITSYYSLYRSARCMAWLTCPIPN